jgi:hypothetical protein
VYQPWRDQFSIGVQRVLWGVDTYYRPWFFTGSIVFWGGFYATESEAIEQAEIIRSNYK